MPHSRADSLSPTRNNETLPFVHDVLIIGAGPCGLAVAARLREQTPSALFTDEEHHRYHWINKHSAHSQIKNSRTGATRPLQSSKCGTSALSDCSMLVLDAEGNQWLSKWNRLFKQLEISHLRSPMFFHPDPRDRDGLLAFAHWKGREAECIEIGGCVGKEVSKHQMKKRRKGGKAAITIDERERKDYFIPPSDLFKEYCEWIAKRYDLLDEHLILKAKVEEMDFDFVEDLSSDERLFTIKAAGEKGGEKFYARSVVLAVGAGNAPEVPRPFPQKGCPHACHAFQPLDGVLKEMRRANVLVIGGGLTSAQIADRAIRKGDHRVWQFMRGPMKVKPFDVDLSWMGKFRNHEKASFWSADTDEERSELVKSARGGGSITPRFAKISERHVRAGRLSIHTHTTVHSASFSPITRTWAITTSPPVPALPPIDFIYFATGVQSEIQTLPYLKPILEKFPVESYEGLPALTDDLMWSEDVPLFVTGKFAALRLGPGAGNLEGARLGAERISWGMQEVFPEVKDGTLYGEVVERKGRRERRRYVAGIGSRFEALAGI
ncbi:FAD binding domain [Lecanosticta acicola]|uniref:L-ornithine N(5)-monooxygenase [NAD(P)H] n=1 Tax=Lecanosticta acicola TaxID=111012 RepID=A0AAI9EDD3_9PEZI|nr:FAD binding domain [Lecanosticta acicola]